MIKTKMEKADEIRYTGLEMNKLIQFLKSYSKKLIDSFNKCIYTYEQSFAYA